MLTRRLLMTVAAVGTPPGAPTSLTATAGDSEIDLSWVAPGDEGSSAITGYKIYRDTASPATTLLDTVGVVTTYNDATASNGTEYFYRVKATNAAGDSDYSNEDSATPVAATISTFVGSFSTGTAAAGNTVAVSGVGFQPSAVIFWWSGVTGTTDATAGGDALFGIGWAAGASSRAAVAVFNDDAVGTSDTDRTHRDDACIAVMADGTAINGLLDFTSFDSDGFTLTVDDAFSASYRVHYMALGGSALTNVATGQFQQATATGNQNITGVGFQPDCILLMTAHHTSAPPGQTTHSTIAVGAASSASDQAVADFLSLNGVGTTDTASYCRSGEVYAAVGATNSVDSRASLSSFDSDGFTLNYAEANANQRYIFYLALKGGNYKVGNLLTQTNTSNFTETGVGFQPTGALFVSHGTSESTSDTPSAHAQISFGGASDASNRAAAALWDEDAVGTSQVARGMEQDEVYLNISTGDAVDGLMDLVSFDSDGMTLVMDDADPSQSFVWYLAIR